MGRALREGLTRRTQINCYKLAYAGDTVTWSIVIGDLHGDNHTLVIAEMPGLWCHCGRPARAMLGLQFAFCDRCAKTQITGAGKDPGYVAERN